MRTLTPIYITYVRCQTHDYALAMMCMQRGARGRNYMARIPLAVSLRETLESDVGARYKKGFELSHAAPARTTLGSRLRRSNCFEISVNGILVPAGTYLYSYVHRTYGMDDGVWTPIYLTFVDII
eukprot:6214757-Pleurochrysis_carterae.AAC.2